MTVFKRAAGYQGDALNLPVPSVAESTAYYEEKFGFRVIERREAPVRHVLLERDLVRIGIAENGGDPTQDGSYFEVDSVDAAYEELKGRGLTPSPPEENRAGTQPVRAFFVVAPDGLCFMIAEPIR